MSWRGAGGKAWLPEFGLSIAVLFALVPDAPARANPESTSWIREAPTATPPAVPARQRTRPERSAAITRPANPSKVPPDARTPPEPKITGFTAPYPPYSIVVVNDERALYLVGEDLNAIRYPIAIGTKDEAWVGKEVVTRKRVNPEWIAEEGDEPVPGGDPENPLGARALYLGKTLWRIHGTIKPRSIGHAASGGCFRMLNEHVIDLYERVPIGTEVYVVNALTDPIPKRRGRRIEDD